MKTFALILFCAFVIAAPMALQAQSGPKSLTAPGFTLKKTTSAGSGMVQTWRRAADGAVLRLELVRGADEKLVARRLQAVNAKIPKAGVRSEELMFLFQSAATTKAWTNYRATHQSTFKTYRFWRLQDGKLAVSEVSFPGKPDFDAARGAFVTARKTADAAARS